MCSPLHLYIGTHSDVVAHGISNDDHSMFHFQSNCMVVQDEQVVVFVLQCITQISVLTDLAYATVSSIRGSPKIYQRSGSGNLCGAIGSGTVFEASDQVFAASLSTKRSECGERTGHAHVSSRNSADGCVCLSGTSPDVFN